MVQKQLSYKDNIITYECYGSGAEYLFCFHGYGQAGYRWDMITPYLGNRFTLVCFDLPFHGNTKWKIEDRFTPNLLLGMIQEILPSSVTQFSLLGYSMGGRIVLSLLQLAPQLVRNVVLLAPDGLHRNKWYRFATHTVVGRRLFYSMAKNPKLVVRLAKQVKKRHLISEGMFNTAMHYMKDEPTRMQLFYRWIATRDFYPDHTVLKRNIVKYGIPVDMVFAKNDRIIIAKRGTEFAEGIETYAHVHVLDAGHAFLYPQYASYIASFFGVEK